MPPYICHSDVLLCALPHLYYALLVRVRARVVAGMDRIAMAEDELVVDMLAREKRGVDMICVAFKLPGEVTSSSSMHPTEALGMV